MGIYISVYWFMRNLQKIEKIEKGVPEKIDRFVESPKGYQTQFPRQKSVQLLNFHKNRFLAT